jgi:hypothetical protein
MKPQLREDDVSQYGSMMGRLSRLEAAAEKTFVVPIPIGASQCDVSVPDGVSIVTLDFEFESPFGSQVVLRPNGDTTILVNDYMYHSSTLSPDAITAPTTVQSSIHAGLFLVGNLGAAGVNRAIGSARVVTRNYSGRTLMSSDTTYTNTVGSGNSYLVHLMSNATYDLTSAISFLRLATSAGNFSGGIVRARYT